MSWTTLIAWRYFKSPKKDKFVNLATNISIVTSTLAIAFLIIAFSIFRGYNNALIQKLTKSSGHIVITDSDPFESKELDHLLINFKTERVLETNGIISCGHTTTPAFLYASSNYHLKNIDSKNIPVTISKSLADLMRYKPTDIITIIVPISAPAPFFILPESVSCEIVKIQKFDSEDLNQNGIVFNLSDLQEVLGIPSKIHKIKCFSTSLEKIDDDFEKLKKAIPKKFVLHWKDINEFFLKVMKSEQNVFMILLIMLMILASLLYILAIAMFINSKKNDIKTLKILGSSNVNIFNIFLKYSMILATLNAILGCLFGVLISFNINSFVRIIERFFKISLFADDVYLINYIPTIFSWIDLSIIIGSSLFISFISSFYISKKMNSIDVF